MIDILEPDLRRGKRIEKYIGNEPFFLTYRDGVADLNITDTLETHRKSGAKISMTVYKPAGKFGSVGIDSMTNMVSSFQEKPDDDGNWINAGYFICEPEVFDYIPENDDTCSFEKQPLEDLAKDGKMHAFKHKGFWKPMDMMRDNTELNEMWDKKKAPWKVW